MNAAKAGTFGGAVNYGISLIVDSHDDAIKVLDPNNNKGGMGNTGLKIANAQGVLFTDLLESRSNSGLTIDMKEPGGDLFIYDATGTKFILGDQTGNNSNGIVLRRTTNPSAKDPLFVVESSGYSERLRVEHNGALKTTNYLEVDGTGDSYIKGSLAVNGTSIPNGYNLAVEGKIIATEIKVEATPWPDYVFSKNYKLSTLEATETYIKKEGHLPNIPSAEEVAKDGILLGEMNAKLLEKIEELTLHLIEQNKQMETMKSDFQKRLEVLEAK